MAASSTTVRPAAATSYAAEAAARHHAAPDDDAFARPDNNHNNNTTAAAATKRPGAAGLLLARLDWALVLPCLACAGLLGSYLVRDVHPRPRAVFATDRTIAMPVVPKAEQMPNYEAPLVPALVLALAAAIAEFLPPLLARRWPASACARPPRGALAAAAFVRAVGGMVVALCATGAVTEFLKVFCGRPRPDYLSRCVPKLPPATEGDAGALLDSLVLSAGRGPVLPVECTATDRAAQVESLKSFPSGHTSSAASVGVWGALYVLHALRRHRGHGAAAGGGQAGAAGAAGAAAKRGANGAGARGGGASGEAEAAAVPRWARELAASGALLLMLFFLAWPWGVGATRFVDNRHHPSDIVGGMLLGATMTAPLFLRFEAVSAAWDARDALDPALWLPRPAAAAAAAAAARAAAASSSSVAMAEV